MAGYLESQVKRGRAATRELSPTPFRTATQAEAQVRGADDTNASRPNARPARIDEPRASTPAKRSTTFRDPGVEARDGLRPRPDAQPPRAQSEAAPMPRPNVERGAAPITRGANVALPVTAGEAPRASLPFEARPSPSPRAVDAEPSVTVASALRAAMQWVNTPPSPSSPPELEPPVPAPLVAPRVALPAMARGDDARPAAAPTLEIGTIDIHVHPAPAPAPAPTRPKPPAAEPSRLARGFVSGLGLRQS